MVIHGAQKTFYGEWIFIFLNFVFIWFNLYVLDDAMCNFNEF